MSLANGRQLGQRVPDIIREASGALGRSLENAINGFGRGSSLVVF